MEIARNLFWKLDIFVHDFESLGETEPTFLFQFKQENSLRIIIDDPGIKQSLAEWRCVETFKNIFILQVPEYLNDFVQSLNRLILLHRPDLLLEYLIKVGD